MKIDRMKVFEKYGGHCAYCGQEISLKQMQVDHYWPQRAHNLDAFYEKLPGINHFDNLMPACRQCNHYKRANLPDNWRETMATLHQRVQKIYIFQVAVNFGMADIREWDGKFYFEKVQAGEIKI